MEWVPRPSWSRPGNRRDGPVSSGVAVGAESRSRGHEHMDHVLGSPGDLEFVPRTIERGKPLPSALRRSPPSRGWIALWVYFGFVYVVLVALMVRTDVLVRLLTKIGLAQPMPVAHSSQPEFYQRMLIYHLSIDATAPRGCVVFVGDSLIQRLCVSAAADHALNFGIGSDDTPGVLERLSRYTSVRKAQAVVMAIGINDLQSRQNLPIVENCEKIIALVPSTIRLVWSAILPVDERSDEGFRGYNERIREINSAMERVCSSRRNCRFVNAGTRLLDATGNLSPEYRAYASQ